MCRLLYVKSKQPFAIKDHLTKFAQVAKNSKEYQGHGWGCAYRVKGEWKLYKNIEPIWDDNFDIFGSTDLLVAHARSAFRDKDIHIDFNMPFIKSGYIYIFNGELHGVKIKEDGKSGAEKIFNYLLRFYKDDIHEAIKKGIHIIKKRSRYIKAMNFIVADMNHSYIYSDFSEDHDYFTMHRKDSADRLIICSEMYPGENDWDKIEAKMVKEIL